MGGQQDRQARVETFEAAIGRKLSVNQHYYAWTDTFPSGLEQWDIAGGRVPLVTWEPWGTSLDQILAGSFDSMIRARARGLKSLEAPVFLRWGHEMNGNWYPWSGYSNNDSGLTNGPAKYVSVYRHIHGIFESEGADNVVWVWSPNSEDVPNTSWNHWSNYYPGDAYVDWVGPDGYNWGTTKSWSSWRSFKSIFAPVYNDYAARKPIMIAETGSQEQGGSKARWITEIAVNLQQEMPAAKALVYFHCPTGWELTSSAEALEAFRALANLSHFLRTQ
jgi:hypothetical protein